MDSKQAVNTANGKLIDYDSNNYCIYVLTVFDVIWTKCIYLWYMEGKMPFESGGRADKQGNTYEYNEKVSISPIWNGGRGKAVALPRVKNPPML